MEVVGRVIEDDGRWRAETQADIKPLAVGVLQLLFRQNRRF